MPRLVSAGAVGDPNAGDVLAAVPGKAASKAGEEATAG
jgi:hypothetical protein